MPVCEVCGNEWEGEPGTCPFCCHAHSGQEVGGGRPFKQRTVNLKAGLPVASVALARMTEAIADSARQGVTFLTLIHGYGSSGKGGVIRDECRKALAFLRDKGVVREVIAGEEFDRRSGQVKALLQRYPSLARDHNLNRGNRGVTLVLLSSWLFCLVALSRAAGLLLPSLC